MFHFIRHIWISNALTAKGYDIRAAFPYQEFCILRLRISAHCNNRYFDSPFDFRNQFGTKAAMYRTGSPHKFIVEMDGAADVERIDTAFLC